MLLSVDNLAIDLMRGADRHPLVSDVSWHLDAGETLAIVGESGSGKSLTALAVMGLLANDLVPVRGRILFQGDDLLKADKEQLRQTRGRQIAMVFQEPMTSLNPVKTIGFQLTEGMIEHLNLSKKEANTRALNLLQQVGISDAKARLKQYPHHLSGGMRQRVMIGIALACKPKVILADEPTTALDVTIQAQILSLMTTLCHEHDVGLVLITHNLGIVAKYAQRVVVMYGGRVVEEADATSLYRSPRHPYTKGLMQSVPRMDTPREKLLTPINGTPPDPFDTIPGCRFHPRCEHATLRCKHETPVPEVEDSHSVACWHWRTLSNHLPVSVSEGIR